MNSALATQPRSGLFTVSFENPEIAAMSAICQLLQALPDDASRLRVMHWSFGRFAPEFKRPVAGTAMPPATVPTAAVVEAVPAAPQVEAAPAQIEATPALEPEAPAAGIPAAAPADMGEQISELGDLFPGRPASAASDPYLDVRGL